MTLVLLTAALTATAGAPDERNAGLKLLSRVNSIIETHNDDGSEFSESKHFLMWSQTFIPGQSINFIWGEFGTPKNGLRPLLVASEWHRGPFGRLTKVADLRGTFDPEIKIFQGSYQAIEEENTVPFGGAYSYNEDGTISWLSDALLSKSGKGLVF